MIFMWREGDTWSGDWIGVRVKSLQEARQKIQEYYEFEEFTNGELLHTVMNKESAFIEFSDVVTWFEGE